MKKLYDNIEDQHNDFFEKAKVSYSTSKEDVWAQMMQKIEEKPEPIKQEPKVVKFNFSRLAVAASVAVLLGLVSFFKLYTKSISVPYGEQLSHVMPDGSYIELTAGSRLDYQPYWWYVERTLNFEGEAFFQVEKGSNFAVVSSNGITQVLGTSFNISTRNDDYQVYCVTGKVRVSDPNEATQVILTPEMYTNSNSGFKVLEKVKGATILAWRSNEFYFDNKPLHEVFESIERKYSVQIMRDSLKMEDLTYTGNFKTPKDPAKAINLICKSFGFSLDQDSSNQFVINISE